MLCDDDGNIVGKLDFQCHEYNIHGVFVNRWLCCLARSYNYVMGRPNVIYAYRYRILAM